MMGVCVGCGNFMPYDLVGVGLCYDCLSGESEEKNYEKNVDELVEIIEVSPESFEDVIENALKKKCFIEAISLIHNVIEAYLKFRLNNFFGEDKERFDLLKSKIKFNYLLDYNGFCYILGLINKEWHLSIVKFNSDRNNVIHDLLKKSIKVAELKKIAREGREIQMRLSPLNHSERDIERIMSQFDKITN